MFYVICLFQYCDDNNRSLFMTELYVHLLSVGLITRNENKRKQFCKDKIIKVFLCLYLSDIAICDFWNI